MGCKHLPSILLLVQKRGSTPLKRPSPQFFLLQKNIGTSFAKKTPLRFMPALTPSCLHAWIKEDESTSKVISCNCLPNAARIHLGGEGRLGRWSGVYEASFHKHQDTTLMSKMLVCFTEHSTSELMMQSRHLQSNSLCCGNSAICSSRFWRLLKNSGTKTEIRSWKQKNKIK